MKCWQGVFSASPRLLTRPFASPECRTSALLKLSQRLASRGMGQGMGGGGHANNPAFTFQSDWQKNKWKPAIFVVSVMGLGTFIPCFMMNFAQKKAGVKWSD